MALGQFISNLGSKLRLPEFGISERFGYNPNQAVLSSQTAAPVPQASTQFPMSTAPRMTNQPFNAGARPAPAPAGNLSGVGNPFAGVEDSARSQVDAELQSALSAFDYNREQAQNQLSSLGGQKEQALSQLGTELQGVQTQVGRSKTNAKEGTERSMQDALTTSQEVTRKNRNILRSLGILNSSAAGELLSKPGNEYDVQRAKLSEALIQREQELDDFMNQKTAEHSQAVQSIVQQYGDMVNNIQTDLRFNDRQRADAVKAANAALSQRISEIKMAQFNYESQVKSLKTNYDQGLQKLNQYEQPTADTGAINATTINTPAQQTPEQVGLYEGEKKKRGDLLSGYSNA